MEVHVQHVVLPCDDEMGTFHMCLDFSLHVLTSPTSQVETRGCVLFTLEVARLLGLAECRMASSSDQLLLRILMPILKLYTAKQAVTVASEGLESFGGQGYIEDTGLPTFLRDAQVPSVEKMCRLCTYSVCMSTSQFTLHSAVYFSLCNYVNNQHTVVLWIEAVVC